MQDKDSTATHFIAHKKKDKIGFAITLYRFMGRPKYGQTECNCHKLNTEISRCHYCISTEAGKRPQYLGPLGWSFHSAQRDEDIIANLQTIDKLEEVTGDNLEEEIWQEGNIYAG